MLPLNAFNRSHIPALCGAGYYHKAFWSKLTNDRSTDAVWTVRLLGVRCPGTALVQPIRNSCQSGARAPHSKEAHNLQAGMNLDRRIFAK